MPKTKSGSEEPNAPTSATSSLDQFFARGDRDGWPAARFTRQELVDIIREDRESGHRD